MTASKGLFGKYKRRIFIETGSNYGDGIQQALDEGFDVVFSVEIDKDRYEHCCERFKDNHNVHLINDDTLKFLSAIMPLIDEPVTFWLDAHHSSSKSPLIQELDIISNHKIKTHTILIDDLRDWKINICGFNTDRLKGRILKINKNYRFILEEGYVPEDVLVAYI